MNDGERSPVGSAEQVGFLPILLVVLAIVVVAGAIALPNLLAINHCSEETAAIATLRNLVSCQEQFRLVAAVDTDGDGTGEFGTLRELTAATPLRTAAGGTGRLLDPPVLSPTLSGVTTEGWVEKSHYAYAVFLPRPGGGWIRETGTVPAGPAEELRGCSGSSNAPTGTAGVSAVGTVDPDLAEREWCAIAWPRMLGDRTTRVFFATSRGEVLQAANVARVSCGTELPQGPADVLPRGWEPGDPVPGGYTSRTGEVWKTTN